jgi:dipeptidyl aminopeptidase/acylaminoacyl peptidase
MPRSRFAAVHRFFVLCIAACSVATPGLLRAAETDKTNETYGEALTKRLGVHAVNLDVDGKPAFVLMPPSDKQQTPQPWIMYAPALSAYPDDHEAWMHRQFVDAGIAVAGIDAGEAYGSPAGSKALSTLYQQLVERRDFARQPCLLGRSRGGLWVTSWAADNADKVAGIAGIYPVFDLRAYPGLEKAAPAYELSPEELERQLDQRNPIARLQPLIDARTPMFMVHGAVDEVVPLESNSAAVAEKFKAADAGDCVTIKVIEGQGHNFDESFFKCQELVDFAIEQAREGAKD